MRYSLLSRFQGTLLAAALGHELGAYWRSQQSIPQSRVDGSGQTWSAAGSLTGWYPGLNSESALSKQLSGGRTAVSCARVLIDCGGWNERELAAIGMPLTTSDVETDFAKERRSGGGLGTAVAAELTIATLPLTLFFHEDESRQQHYLLRTLKLWHCPPDAEAGLLAVGYAIAQVLQNRLWLQTVLPQTIAHLKQSTNSTAPLLDLIDKLEQAQTLVQQRYGLYTAIEQLQARTCCTGNEAIALAFYCFLSTPHDLRLALLRAARCGEAAPVVAALTGALSGAYHSINGLPLVWQLAASPLWGITDSTLHQLATHLFAAWSGVYAPALQMMPNVAIAAPGIIRPR